MPDFTDYLTVCTKCLEDENCYLTFKHHPHYYNIVGMHSRNYVQEYSNNICRNCDLLKDYTLHTKQYLTLACKKDEVGQPPGVWENGIDGWPSIDPTSFSYLSVTSDLLRLFNSLKGVSSICEIGGGYGGQARKILSYQPSIDYTIIDLMPVLKLIDKVQDDLSLGLVNATAFLDKGMEENEYDLLISNYAFTECPREFQEAYMDKVLKHCKNGYMVCNCAGLERMTLGEIIDKLESYGKNVSICNEVPFLFPHFTNKLLTWSEKNVSVISFYKGDRGTVHPRKPMKAIGNNQNLLISNPIKPPKASC